MSVYLISDRAAGVCKIGFSRSPRRRLAILQTSSAAHLELEAVIPGDQQCERDLHACHASAHVMREWFRITPEISQLIGHFRCGAPARQAVRSVHQNAATKIIEQLGGPSKVAAETGFPVTTVHSWVRSDRIPHWRRAPLMDLAKRLGVPLTVADFPDASAQSAQQDAAA